jgi:hypothetical protein
VAQCKLFGKLLEALEIPPLISRKQANFASFYDISGYFGGSSAEAWREEVKTSSLF